MKSTKQKVVALEAELLRLNSMVRARREQLAKLETCPHKDCECRAVWHKAMETDLASQMGKISQSVRPKSKVGSRKLASQSPKKR